MGILTFCPTFLSKTSPPGQRILSKNTKIPTLGQGSYVKCSYPEAMLFILGIHCDKTRQKKLYVAKNTKNRYYSSIQIVINTKTQLMREQEANIILLLNSIKYNMLSLHTGDVGQTARPWEREKSNIRTLGRVHEVKSHSLGHECLIKIPPAPGITLIGALLKRFCKTMKNKELTMN